MTRGVASSNATMVTSSQLNITQQHIDIKTVRSQDKPEVQNAYCCSAQ